MTGFPPNGFARNEDVGSVFTNGSVVIFNKGDEPVTLVSITPKTSGPNLKYLGSRIAGMQRTIGYNQYEARFPPSESDLGPLREAIGAVLEPGDDAETRGYELLMGYQVTGNGRSTVTGVRVDYTKDGRRRHLDLVATMAVCTPADSKTECEQEYAGS